MGDRYILTVICPRCGHLDDDVYYAPTCGFTVYQCRCGHMVDLELYSGIPAEECSNAAEIREILEDFLDEEEDDDDDSGELPEAVPA